MHILLRILYTPRMNFAANPCYDEFLWAYWMLCRRHIISYSLTTLLVITFPSQMTNELYITWTITDPVLWCNMDIHTALAKLWSFCSSLSHCLFRTNVDERYKMIQLKCDTWYHHLRCQQFVLNWNLIIFKVTTGNYRCPHKDNCICQRRCRAILETESRNEFWLP